MAREILFEIDGETGELTTHIRGIVGPGCEDVARLVEEYVGEPTSEAKTAEYHQRARVRPRLRGGQGGGR